MPTAAQRVAAVVRLIEDAAVEVDAASHRLRALGLAAPADESAALALNLAKLCRSVTGRSSETLITFFGIGAVSFDDATENESSAPAHAGMPWLKNV